MFLLLFTIALGLQIARSDAQSFSVYGLNYNARKGPDWAPESAKCKSPDEIKQDIETIKKVTSIVRLYSLVDCNQGALVIPAALNAGLKVSVGLWVSDDPAVFRTEKAKLEELIQPKRGIFNADKIFDIHVGSEAIYRKEVTPATNIAYMREIKQLCSKYPNTASIPVTIAEIGDTYFQHEDLIDAVDIVSANGFPFWEKWEVSKSAERFRESMEKLVVKSKGRGKEVFIGETGWASAGSSPKASKASPENAATYLRDFKAMAETHGWKYFYFAAFDEAWKIEGGKEDTVEAHFGLFHADRSLKEEFRSLADSNTSTAGRSPSPAPAPAPSGGQTLEIGSADAPGHSNSESPTVTPAPTPVPVPSPTPAATGAATGDSHKCMTA